MTFLPIVDRELRVAARRRGTYWARLGIALMAIIIGAFVYISNPRAQPQERGHDIFAGLSFLCILYCLFAGRRSTADCLSEEKREGTLGLLFLTDLKGYDVVFGKLAATSLNGFYALLAVFPVLAVPLLMGGVTNGEFWRMVLVLVNTCLFSLAIGIFVSSMSRDSRQAFGANLLLNLLLVGVLPACVGLMLAFVSAHLFIPELLLSCPFYSFYLAFEKNYAAQKDYFWISLGVVHCLAWLHVLLACSIVPRTWQDKPARAGRRRWRDLWNALNYGRAATRAAFRRRLLDVNAFYWLASRMRLKPLHVWIFLGMMAVWWISGWMSEGHFWLDAATGVAMALILNSALKLWVALEAGQRLAEDQRAGALELLLSTRLSVPDILRGQFLALRRQFIWPILVVIVVELVFMCTTLRQSPQLTAQTLALWICGILMLVADAITLSWVGMATALRARSPNHASVSTITRVLILPWILMGLVVGIANILSFFGIPEPGWKFYLGAWFVFGIIADVVFGFIAKWNLQNRFRELALQRFTKVTPRSPR
jgi:ABC-2 family transporter protein